MKNQIEFRSLLCSMLFGAVVLVPAMATAQQTLLFDDFDAAPLDSSIWGLASWNIGDRTQFGNQPEFHTDADGSYITLPLDTYNPNLPGQRVLGTEIFSLQRFDNPEGVEFLTRARLNTEMPGLVAAFFTYSEKRQKGRYVSDEIDYEVLSKQGFNRVLVTSWDNWGAAGSNYEDGVHHLGALLDLNAYDWRQWNTYAMRWYPDRVEWHVNGELVRVHYDAPVPDQPQPARASLWAAGSTWPDAYDALLAPVSDPAQNQRFRWDIDYILVTSLGGGGPGDPDTPAAPTGLAASVIGSEVNLSWTDASTDESGFRVYRAVKPKGKSNPEFTLIASPASNVTGYSDTVADGQYVYQVTAWNDYGESQPGNTVTVKVGSGGKGGGKPQN